MVDEQNKTLLLYMSIEFQRSFWLKVTKGREVCALHITTHIAKGIDYTLQIESCYPMNLKVQALKREQNNQGK